MSQYFPKEHLGPLPEFISRTGTNGAVDADGDRFTSSGFVFTADYVGRLILIEDAGQSLYAMVRVSVFVGTNDVDITPTLPAAFFSTTNLDFTVIDPGGDPHGQLQDRSYPSAMGDEFDLSLGLSRNVSDQTAAGDEFGFSVAGSFDPVSDSVGMSDDSMDIAVNPVLRTGSFVGLAAESSGMSDTMFLALLTGFRYQNRTFTAPGVEVYWGSDNGEDPAGVQYVDQGQGAYNTLAGYTSLGRIKTDESIGQWLNMFRDNTDAAVHWHSRDRGAAVTTANTEPFALVEGSDLNVDVEGLGVENVVFTAGKAEIASGAGPFNINDQGTLKVKVNQGAPQIITFNTTPAQLECVTAELYNLFGLTLSISVDGGGDQDFLFTGTSGSQLSGNSEAFAIDNGETLLVKINGEVTAQTLTLGGVTSEAATAAEIVSSLDSQLTGGTITAESGQVRITSDTIGTGSSGEVTGGTAGADMAYPGGVSADQSGSAADLQVVTALEVRDFINATITGAAAAATSGNTKVTVTTTGSGTGFSLQIDGTANTPLGFVETLTNGTGDFVDASAATSTELEPVITAGLSDADAAVQGSAVRIRTLLRGTTPELEVPVGDPGTSNAALGFTTTVTNGTGNFATLSLATAEEVAAEIELLTTRVTGLVRESGTKATMESNQPELGTASTIEVPAGTPGTANSVLGFPTGPLNGLLGGPDPAGLQYFANGGPTFDPATYQAVHQVSEV